MSEGARKLTGPTLSCLLLQAMSTCVLAMDDPGVERETFRHSFLTSHCGACHGGNDQKAGVDFRHGVPVNSDNAVFWRDVLHQLQRGDMPPADAAQPPAAELQRFVMELAETLDHVTADSAQNDPRFLRLTNRQIVWSLQDVLQIDRDFGAELLEDPQHKHGQSLQSHLEMSAGYLESLLSVLQQAVELAVSDPQQPPPVYVLQGNDWEQQHYLNRNDLAHGARRHHRRYRGPQWLGDDFEVPLPPNHFFRIYIDDNRSQGQFRVRLRVRNEPPTDGGERQQHQMSVFFDKGFKSPMHTVGSFTVEAQPGVQEFEVLGNVFDFPGVDPAPLREDEEPWGVTAHFKYRFLTIQNCSPLTSPSDKPVTNQDWVIHGAAHFIRADDRWTDAWGNQFAVENWLQPSHGGSNHDTRGKPAVYREVMQDTSHVILEQVEFALPWQWPLQSSQPFLENGQLTDASVRAGLLNTAARAWRRPLLASEQQELQQQIDHALLQSDRVQAVREVLLSILADARFLYLTRSEQTVPLQNTELVSRLAAFLWQSVPDGDLQQLASQEQPIADSQLLAQVDRMLEDDRADRFVAEFAAVFMNFRRLDQIAVNPNYYGWWNPKFKDYMKAQSVAFFRMLLRDDISCLNCLSSDFVVLNDVMARFHGLPVPDSGHQFSRVPAPAHLGGLLTQPAFLLAHSDGEDSHAVHRGVWLRGRLLGDPPRDPPPNVPALDDLTEQLPEGAAQSTAARLALHGSGLCRDCHQDIDPWGVALEQFDAAGRLRQKILRLTPESNQKRHLQPVSSESVIRGQTVKNSDELRLMLREHYANEFASGFSGMVYSWALGRPLSYRDHDAVKQLAVQFVASDYRLPELLRAVVMQSEFRSPSGGPRAPANAVSE